ncbi:hypothetical protein lbkm_1520 [Lachnospiraceae bacterium KM106-2]|nr:hypothetical protein lbkm_1520 [Lachnospiraceae bacterium KM106-2]
MKFDFLNQFDKRMKNVGMYAVLFRNSMNKNSWKQYGIETFYEQINFIFAVLLYIMDQSLREDVCTMDDITSYLDSINEEYFHKPLSYAQTKEMAEFIVNVILCDEGRAMYFDAYNFDDKSYKEQHVSYIANRIVYLEGEVRRTSYYMTDDGYTFLLGTLEIENNMKLTIYEMIFKLHLERATYDKAAEDVKQIFNRLRIQLQKIQEAMRKIKQNALSYSVTEYRELLEENLHSLEQTNRKFKAHKDMVNQRVKELEEKDINIQKLDDKERENLMHLKEIDRYLSRSIDELQKLFLNHFDLKTLYAKELESISQMALVKRYNLRTDLYDQVLKNADSLLNMEEFFRPLLKAPMKKSYNINQALHYPKSLKTKEDEDQADVLDFDAVAWEEEQRKLIRAKLKRYDGVIHTILREAKEKGSVSLKDIKESEEDTKTLIPNVEIFKEVIVELLKNKVIDVAAIRKERENMIAEQPLEFQVNLSVLAVLGEEEELGSINKITTIKLEDDETVTFEAVQNETGQTKNIVCSNIEFRVE